MTQALLAIGLVIGAIIAYLVIGAAVNVAAKALLFPSQLKDHDETDAIGAIIWPILLLVLIAYAPGALLRWLLKRNGKA